MREGASKAILGALAAMLLAAAWPCGAEWVESGAPGQLGWSVDGVRRLGTNGWTVGPHLGWLTVEVDTNALAQLAAFQSTVPSLSVADARRIVQANTNSWLVLTDGTGVLYVVSPESSVMFNTNEVVVTQSNLYGDPYQADLPVVNDEWAWGYSYAFEREGYVGIANGMSPWLLYPTYYGEYGEYFDGWRVMGPLSETSYPNYYESAVNASYYEGSYGWELYFDWNGTITNWYLVTNAYPVATEEFVAGAIETHNTSGASHSDIRQHAGRTDNPHTVTLTQVGGVSAASVTDVVAVAITNHDVSVTAHTPVFASTNVPSARWDSYETSAGYWVNSFETNWYRACPGVAPDVSNNYWVASGFYVGTLMAGMHPQIDGVMTPMPNGALRSIEGAYVRSPYLVGGIGTISFAYSPRSSSSSTATGVVQYTESDLPTSGWVTVATLVVQASVYYYGSFVVNNRNAKYFRIIRTDPTVYLGQPASTLNSAIILDNLLITPCKTSEADFKSVSSMWVSGGQVYGIVTNKADSLDIGPYISGSRAWLYSNGTNLWFITASGITTNALTSN